MRPERVELPTYGFVVRRSIQLSYGRGFGSVANFLGSGCGTVPKKEEDAKRRVRGEEKNFCTPHPALRATLSLRERDSAPKASRNLDSTAEEPQLPADQEQPLVEPQFRHL
jgi:hypothetical protein